MVSLSKRGMDDASLNTLINGIPSRAMILMEDIDAAFTRSVTREPPGAISGPLQPGMTPEQLAPSSVTLSGLLNAIDGVQAQQGRLLFATTNKYDALDPALVRPGRLDLHIEFSLASKWQASELFKRFYPVIEMDIAAAYEKNWTKSLISPTSGGDVYDADGKSQKPTLSVVTENLEEDLSALQRITTSGLKATQRGRKAPRLTQIELETLAERFASAIPDQELSMAYVFKLVFFVCPNRALT